MRLKTPVLILLSTLFLLALAVTLWIGDHYRWRIYPGVTITAPFATPVDVGGLTPAVARARLRAALPDPARQTLTLHAGDRTWRLTWADVGQRYAIDIAVDAAYDIGRDHPWWLAVVPVVRVRPHSIHTRLSSADPDIVRAHVDAIAGQIARAPQDAAIAIINGELVVQPAVAGRYLDPAAATDLVLGAFAENRTDVDFDAGEIAPRIAPRIADAEPAHSAAAALLQHPLTLSVHDPLTGDRDHGGYRATFRASPREISTWLWFVERHDAYHLNISPSAIRDWVTTLAPAVSAPDPAPTATTATATTSAAAPKAPPGRILDADATAARITQVLRAASTAPSTAAPPSAAAVVRHPPITYTVQPGDVFYDIAYLHRFPQWQLEQANPEVDPGRIDVGQVLVIPSLDVLFPHPIVPGKVIEVDLPTQTLTAYQDGTPHFEFTISSGISTTPTLAGQFQVLFKEEAGYARRWRLDMPHFMGFYEEGDGFYNGFHALPITAYGTRLSSGVLGYPASFGCIILDTDDAAALYDWTEVGTLVRVHGVAPGTPFGQPTLDDLAPLVP